MTTKKIALLLSASILYCCLSYVMCWAEVYPLPFVELEGVITRHLKSAGFHTEKKRYRTGGMEIRAYDGERHCVIRLQPFSALASSANVACFKEGEPDTHFESSISDYVNSYLSHNINALEKPRALASDTIPPFMLAMSKTVVCLKAKTEEKEVQFSGFFVAKEGLILSTAHDLEKLLELTVIFYDGEKRDGQLIARDRHLDLALVSVNRECEDFISIAHSRNYLQLGEFLYSIGCPSNVGGTIQSGVVNSSPRLVDGLPLWQVAMSIYPGSSGSPVFDVQGHLVAVVKGRFRGTDSIGFLIPMETVVAFAKEHAS